MDEGAYPSLPPLISEKTKSLGDIAQEFRNSIGLITVKGKTETGQLLQYIGTCFVVRKDGYALTAAHTLTMGQMNREILDREILVSLGSRSAASERAELIKIDQELNVALIKLPRAPYQPTKTSPEQLQIGD